MPGPLFTLIQQLGLDQPETWIAPRDLSVVLSDLRVKLPRFAKALTETGLEPARQQSPGTAERQTHDDETTFQRWYADVAQTYDLNPNPEGQFYDYRAAFKAGAMPDASGHWPSTFKQPGHPNEVVGGFNTRTGARVPGTTQASEAELIRLGWEPATAKRLSSQGADK